MRSVSVRQCRSHRPAGSECGEQSFGTSKRLAVDVDARWSTRFWRTLRAQPW